jgi:hypothetical protein
MSLMVIEFAPAAPVNSGTSDPKKSDSPAEKVRQALDEITDLTIERQPLAVAIAQLRDQGKINLVLDTFQIQQAGIDPQAVEVNLKLNGVKLRTALRSILSPYNLGYAIVGDTVVITTEDLALQRQMRQRVSVDLDQLPLEKALKQLSKETGTNLLLDPRVSKEAQNPVTLQADDVPLDTAVKLLAQMAGLRTVPVGNVVFVTSKATAIEMRQDVDLVGPPVMPNALALDGGFLGGAQMRLGGAGALLGVPPPGVTVPIR